MRARLHALAWDLRSWRWGNWFSSEERTGTVSGHVDWVMEHSGPARGRVLDIACGTGDYSIELARRGFSVVGCDFSAGMLARGRSRAAAMPGLRCVFRQADFNTRLRARYGSFDHAICIWALQHANEPAAVLADIARVLKAGGIFLAVAPVTPWEPTYAGRRRRSPLRKRARRFLRHFPGFRPSGRRFTPEEMATLLAAAGFTVVDQRSTRRFTQVLARRL